MADDSSMSQYSAWYVALIAAGAVIAAPAGATGGKAFFLVGVGLVLVGVGGFINHPYREIHLPGGMLHGRQWARSPFGFIVSLPGIGLFCTDFWASSSEIGQYWFAHGAITQYPPAAMSGQLMGRDHPPALAGATLLPSPPS